jgi:hypothetical protein
MGKTDILLNFPIRGGLPPLISGLRIAPQLTLNIDAAICIEELAQVFSAKGRGNRLGFRGFGCAPTIS